MDFLLRLRTALPWLQSNRCQNPVEHLIKHRDKHTKYVVWNDNPVCWYTCATIYHPTDGCLLWGTSTNMFNFAFPYSRQSPFFLVYIDSHKDEVKIFVFSQGWRVVLHKANPQSTCHRLLAVVITNTCRAFFKELSHSYFADGKTQKGEMTYQGHTAGYAQYTVATVANWLAHQAHATHTIQIQFKQ